MRWRKSPPQLIELFHEAVPDDPRVELRKMFGYPCCFVRGNMFMGLHQENFVIRLSEKDRENIFEQGVKPFAPMPGRIMKQYAALPKSILKNKTSLGKWINRSLEYALSLPPKTKKKKAPSKGRKTNQKNKK